MDNPTPDYSSPKIPPSPRLTPTCPSSTHVAYGAIRLEWTFMILGQAVGDAASLAIDDRVPVQKVDYPRLKTRLLADKQVLAVP